MRTCVAEETAATRGTRSDDENTAVRVADDAQKYWKTIDCADEASGTTADVCCAEADGEATADDLGDIAEDADSG
jgi:hypothetical protein